MSSCQGTPEKQITVIAEAQALIERVFRSGEKCAQLMLEILIYRVGIKKTIDQRHEQGAGG